MLCGYPPFYGDTDTQIFESVRVGRSDFPSPEWDKISETAKGFISAMLKRDPSKRPSAAQALEHPWIKELTEEREKLTKRSSIVFAPRSIAFIKYRDMQKLQKSALAWLAANATNEDITSLKDIFDEIDVNNDGTITLQELDTCLENAHFPPNITGELRKLREDLSISGEASLIWRDFIALTMDKNLVMKEDNLRMVFEHFKKSDRDYIVISDIVELVGVSKEQAMDIMKLADENSDGRIDFNEFRKMMEDENTLI